MAAMLTRRAGAAAGGGSRHAPPPADRVRAKPAVRSTASRSARRILTWLAGHGIRDVVAQPPPSAGDRRGGRRRRIDLGVARPLLLGAAGARVGRRAAHALPLLTDGTVTDLPDRQRRHADTRRSGRRCWPGTRASGALVTMALIPNPRPDEIRRRHGVRRRLRDRLLAPARRRASRFISSACRSAEARGVRGARGRGARRVGQRALSAR